MELNANLPSTSRPPDGVFRRWLRPLVRVLSYGRHRLAPQRTYAADYEDVAAWTLLGGVNTFVDVGANDGFTCSNTFLFAMRGARGFCFEPDPENFKRLSQWYRCQSRVRCIQQGMSDRAGRLEMRSDGLLSAIIATDDVGLGQLLATWRNPDAALVEIEVSTLAHYFLQQPDHIPCDVLSIDVEGHELSVLRGIDWEATPKPARCVIVETHSFAGATPWRHRDFNEIAELLKERGYREVAASQNNTFWLSVDEVASPRTEEARLLLPHYQWRE